MKLGEIWDYVMRRKARFLVLAAVLFLAVAGISRMVVRSKPLNSVEVPMAETYNSSLILRIAGAGAKTPSYQLTFTNDYTRAVVSVTDGVLGSEAYVRIFDPSGNLLYGEYTAIEDVVPTTPTTEKPSQAEELEAGELEGPVDDALAEDEETEPVVTAVVYRFINTPKTYEVALEPGSIIEVRSTEAKFLSTLDNAEATAFRPEGTERYIMNFNGLRKENWSEAKGLAENYQLLRRFLVKKIEDYRAQVSEEILSDKELDQAAKMKIVAAYNSLAEADQAEYQEFIGHLLNGKPKEEDPSETEPGETEKPDDTKPEAPAQPTEPAPSEDKNQSAVVVEEVVLPNDPVSSVNHQSIQALGERTETTVVSYQGEAQTVAVATPEAEEATLTAPQVTSPTNTTSQATTSSNTKPQKDEAKEMPIWQKIGLLVIGIAALMALIRFIFDHYVR